jgi:coenzyme PQQ precursor peptide PqqA
MWTKPAAADLRFGFEVTMYIAARSFATRGAARAHRGAGFVFVENAGIPATSSGSTEIRSSDPAGPAGEIRVSRH